MPVLQNKVAVVTGASRGIGAGIARRLAAEGARVAVNYSTSRDTALAIAAETGGVAIEANVADPVSVARLFDEAQAALGPIDILVNNAGVALLKPLAESTIEEYDRVFSINTRGAFLCLREASSRIREGGRIVNISTGATVASPPNMGVYSASKAALEQFTRAAAKELGARGITVNTVSPGFTETDMFQSVNVPQHVAASMSALGRVGTPADIAAVVVFLCSSDGAWITGQNIQAGGGLSMV
jgi:3-oxoacyl-[acyl-carrier protein] reductase